jgi:hypothetical protein
MGSEMHPEPDPTVHPARYTPKGTTAIQRKG